MTKAEPQERVPGHVTLVQHGEDWDYIEYEYFFKGKTFKRGQQTPRTDSFSTGDRVELIVSATQPGRVMLYANGR